MCEGSETGLEAERRKTGFWRGWDPRWVMKVAEELDNGLERIGIYRQSGETTEAKVESANPARCSEG